MLQPLTTSVRWQSTRVETLVWCAQVIRPMYSNPPRHGAAIVATILGDPRLYEQWKVELKGMADRIITMREKLHQALVDQGAPGDWSFILKQIGMFSFTGLTKVDRSDRMSTDPIKHMAECITWFMQRLKLLLGGACNAWAVAFKI